MSNELQPQSSENADAATTADATPGEKPKTRQKLTTARDCHMLLARYVRAWMRGDARIDDVSKLANILQIQARLIDGASLSDRVEALEAALTAKGRAVGRVGIQ